TPMGLDAWIVLGVVAAAVALFVSERFPIEQVAIAVPVVLLLTGVLRVDQAVAGLSNPATVTVGAMLVMSLGLQKTGAIAALGRWARSAPLGGPTLRLFLLCVVVAAVSPFLNNTAVVVVFLPIFVSLARQAGKPASKYLIPLSYTAILGGTATLIGTSTNLIVFGIAESRGYDQLSLFTVTPLGIAFVAVGLVYLFTVGRRLLPER
ncbi:MAG: SLC13 family permease, partial [Gemmatimonadota bacterium]